MKNYLKDSNSYLVIAFVIMAILFFSLSQTCEQRSQAGLLDKPLSNHPFEEQPKDTSFQYAGSEMGTQASGYSKLVEFFIHKGAHFGMYSLSSGSWLIGLVPRIKGLFLMAIASWLAVAGYMGLDEPRRIITGGRTSLLQDVMLDTVGALTAIATCLMVRGSKENEERRR